MILRDEVVIETIRLLDLQQYRGYRIGWVWCELQEQFQYFSLEELKVIATGLRYNPKWALHKWKEQEEKRRYFYPETEPPRHPLQDFLDVLEIEIPFNLIDLKRAYRRLSLIYHPDVGGDSETFVRVTEAYEYLKLWAEGAA